MKSCSKCRIEYPATLEYFPPHKQTRDRLGSHCRKCHRNYVRKWQQRQYKQRVEYQKRYFNTIRGRLRRIYGSMKNRCNNLRHDHYKNYGGRGIKLKFTINGFTDYAINVLKIDPRGLEVHRIDNDGHYEKGNIEFLTSKEHGLKHRGINQ